MFVELSSQKTMDEFLLLVNGFHDALLRELAIVAQGYVRQDGWMEGDVAPSDARLVFHSQSKDTPLIEMIAESVERYGWKSGWDLDPAQGTVTDSGVTICFGPHSDTFVISAERMKYRILGREYLGEQLHVVKEAAVTEDDSLNLE